MNRLGRYKYLLINQGVIHRCLSTTATNLTNSHTVRVGCASGFWGDTPTAAHQLISKGNVDYLIYDYLSELTMSLLTAAKQKDPRMGYATDFIKFGIGPYLKEAKSQGIKVITNAGGINTSSCAAALAEAAKKSGVELKIAQVHGDNLMGMYPDLLQDGSITDMSSGKPLPKTIHSMTAYFGAAPIMKALSMGADIVVTGRTADSALALAPLAHEFGWSLDRDWNQLAAGSLAGHLIECGGQATGGLYTDWHEVPGYENLGFPVAEVDCKGDILISKPANTGGLLTDFTVAEQMLYEIGDPAAYILPDVTCDFTNVTMTLQGEKVLVTGARGKPAPRDFKVCATYLDGFKATAVAVVVGGRADKKARKTGEAILNRSRGLLKKLGHDDFSKTHLSIIGAEDAFGGNKRGDLASREAVIWMSVAHKDPTAINVWAREIASAGTGMSPGLCGMVGGRPKATPCLKLFSFLFPKHRLQAKVELDETEATVEAIAPPSVEEGSVSPPNPEVHTELKKGRYSYRLEELALARSGDKGNSCNIGVIARNPGFLPYIRERLTEDVVFQYFEHLFGSKGKVKRFDVPGIDAVNFLLEDVLDGGGIASMRPDPLGKAFGQILLDIQLHDLPKLDDMKV